MVHEPHNAEAKQKIFQGSQTLSAPSFLLLDLLPHQLNDLRMHLVMEEMSLINEKFLRSCLQAGVRWITWTSAVQIKAEQTSLMSAVQHSALV